MKIRSVFVSNSSSSSFIVGCKPGKTKIKLTIEVDLSRHGDVLKTEEEVKKHIKEELGWRECDLVEDGYAAEWYEEMMKQIKAGNHVIAGSFSSEGDPLDQFLCDNGLNDIESEDINVIQSNAGY